MNRFFDASRRFLLAAGRAMAAAWKVALAWLSIPVNLCLATIGLVFLVSFASWAIGDPFEEALLFFPDSKGALRGETRGIPHSWGNEARAELVASELLLGPRDSALMPAFTPGLRVESAIYRKGRLFIDVSPQAALDPPASLRRGLDAMERSLKAALPGMKRLSLTIGGIEPYMAGLALEGVGTEKKQENN